MLTGVRCPFCDHEMEPGRLDAEGLLGWRAFTSVVWKPADRKHGDWRRLSGFLRRRAAKLCEACGALVVPPTQTGTETL